MEQGLSFLFATAHPADRDVPTTDIHAPIFARLTENVRHQLRDGRLRAIALRRETREHPRCPFMRFNAIDHLEARVLTERALEHTSSYTYAWKI